MPALRRTEMISPSQSARVARTIVRIAALLAPAHLRAEWREEWEAELWHESRRKSAGHTGSLIVAALGAFRDALAMHSLAGVKPARPFQNSLEQWGLRMLHDLRPVLRGMVRSPGFSLLGLLTLALGLGASAALFTVVYAVLLRPLPYVDSSRLVRIEHPAKAPDPERPWGLSMHGYFHIADNNRTLEGLGVYIPLGANLAGDEGPAERVTMALVSASLFSVVGARPHAGRLFVETDHAPSNEPAIVLGYDFWQRRYGGDVAVVGRTIRVNGVTRTVVGVAPRGLHLPNASTDLWAPVALNRSSTPELSHPYLGIGRLREGVTVQTASADMARLTAQFPQAISAYTAGFMEYFGFTGGARPLRESVVGSAAKGLWIVFGAVVLVLLIACANVANLFLVRTEGRRREIAIRSALGATRGQHARFFLTESLLLTLLAGAVGLTLAIAGVRFLVALAPAAVPRIQEIVLGPSSILFMFAVSLLVGLSLGLFPLFRIGGAAPQTLQTGTARQTSTRAGVRMRSVLVSAQIALAVILLAGAGLLLQSFDRLRNVQSGFDSRGVLTFEMALSRTYRTSEQWNPFYQQFLERVRSLPGVVATGGSTTFPLKDPRDCRAITIPSAPPAVPGDPPRCVNAVWVTPGFFAAMGIRIEGREPEWRENAAYASGVLVSRPLAQRLWPGSSALDREIKVGGESPPYFRIVGITAPVRLSSLTEPPDEVAYFPIVPPARGERWFTPGLMTIAVRTTLENPAALLPEIRRVLAEVDAEIPIANVRTADEIVSRSLARVSFVMLLLGIAAGLALLLGTVGLYGVIAYVVGHRRAEISIRMALGARVSEVAGMVVLQSLRIAVAGVLVGLLGALLVTRVMRSLLFEISPTDPSTLAAVSALLLLTAVAASGLPALHAARVDPANTLRAS
jgi:putative ABC transport system permease protein